MKLESIIRIKFKIKQKAKFMIERFLNIIFPKVCLNCGKQGDTYLCNSCFFSIDLKFKILKKQNKRYDYLVYLGNYKGDIREKLLKFKFYNSAYINEYFLEFLFKSKNVCDFLKKFDMVIPVPMYKSKKLRRGYNQTELLAENLNKKLNIEYKNDVLIKFKENQTQSLLNEKQRKANVKNVFKIQNENKVYGKNIILLDDILTTGSTIEECSKILKRAGVKKIAVLVISKSK